jgi:hypothetical protein
MAAPYRVTVSAPNFEAQIVLDDWHENLVLLVENPVATDVSRLQTRHYLNLSLFWAAHGPSGKPTQHVKDSVLQEGRLYPKSGDEPALIAVIVPVETVDALRLPTTRIDDSNEVWVVRPLSDRAAKVFESHGVRVRGA